MLLRKILKLVKFAWHLEEFHWPFYILSPEILACYKKVFPCNIVNMTFIRGLHSEEWLKVEIFDNVAGGERWYFFKLRFNICQAIRQSWPPNLSTCSLSLGNDFLLIFLLHFVTAGDSPLYSSPNWQSYRTINHPQELSERKEEEELLNGDSANQWLLNNLWLFCSIQHTWIMSSTVDGYNYKNVLRALGTYHLAAEIRVNHINQLGNNNNNNNNNAYFGLLLY